MDRTIKGSLFIKFVKQDKLNNKYNIKNKLIQVYYSKHNYHNYNLT